VQRGVILALRLVLRHKLVLLSVHDGLALEQPGIAGVELASFEDLRQRRVGLTGCDHGVDFAVNQRAAGRKALAGLGKSLERLVMPTLRQQDAAGQIFQRRMRAVQAKSLVRISQCSLGLGILFVFEQRLRQPVAVSRFVGITFGGERIAVKAHRIGRIHLHDAHFFPHKQKIG